MSRITWVLILGGNLDPERKTSGGLRTKQAGRGSCRDLLNLTSCFDMGYLLKEALKTLCGVNQWSYAIFWKIGCQNPKLLIWEECYYEPVVYSNVGHGGNKVHFLVNKMMKDNYIILLGEGLVGRVAFTRNHQWIISNNKLPGVHPPEVSNEVYTQFSAGIQTIAVIPVHPHGVVQLGSLSTIMENVSFVNDVKGLISQLGCVPGALLSENFMKSEVGPTLSSGSSGHTTSFSLNRNTGNNQVVNGLTSQQISHPKNNQEIGFGSFLEQCITPNTFSGDRINDTIMSNNPPSLPSGKQLIEPKGKVEHELFQALSMSSEEDHLKPPSRDDLFDIVGMDLNGNHDNFINNRVVTNNNTGYEGKSSSGIYSLIPNDNLLDAVVSRVPSSSTPITDNNMTWHNGGINLKKTGVTSSYLCKLNENGGNFSDSSSIISSQIGSWIDKRQELIKSEYDKRPDEIGKSNRKRHKTGENPRPRPKDRQMIQDRVKDLREIVPNSTKCSIDALLERTIKHMVFLQSITKHADKLKQTQESKIVSKEGGLLLKDNFEGGATWAYEVGSQSMVCPIIVEDLNTPRQMLVEMLCEERGSFLEIADVIRGLGLTILKGVMEYRNHKIWAHFTVEANRDVTRMEIFISLVGLFDQSAKNGNIPPANEQAFRPVTTIPMAVRPHSIH
ncbi:hypothetical protein LXL04_014700 [Taraxacum kok-saghyz]